MSKQIDWSEWDHLLGTEKDSTFAKKIGCVASTVRYRRKKLGIKRYGFRGINWSKWDHFLGKESDSAIASRIGCSQSAVTIRRQKLGIILSKRARINWVKWDYLLGTKVDREVAELIGCGLAAVATRRHILGIPRVLMQGWKKLNCPVVVVALTPFENTSELREALKELDPRIRDVLVRRFGIGRSRETLVGIGKGYKLTRERIRQLQEMGLQHLKFLLRKNNLTRS